MRAPAAASRGTNAAWRGVESARPDPGDGPLDIVVPTSPGVRIEVRGLVQGVGFRPWVFGLAAAAGLRGRVWNHAAGVTIEAYGPTAELGAFVRRVARPPMPAARVHELRCEPLAEPAPSGFTIVASRGGEAPRPSIPADLATCDDCRRDVAEPGGRRAGYAFTSCTRCGPRYTIATDVPWDRAGTTMAGFALCPACAREYEDPRDRRFHAEQTACPACGPRLRLVDAQGAAVPGDPVAAAAALLRAGGIVAVKGLGGYHLACDATSATAVATLRRRKQRDAKPFAVMVADLDAAERVAAPTPPERVLLADARRPIVLVARRAGAGLAAELAPGLPVVGLMLPYTPLHELLLAAVGRPLVMTSGNRSDEPMACDDADALRRLGGGIADHVLAHDRAIANRCDDTVARVVAGRPVLLRRGRGWVPGGLRVGRPFPQPVLGTGGHLKNAFCLGAGDTAWLGPHVGDLETHEACADFETMVARFQRFVGVAPAVIAHDLHPDYATTRWALRQTGVTTIGVQHHHAHVASALAEHDLDGPVLGLAWDGTGWGPDGTAWGGELLLATLADYRRVATLRSIALAGGEAAIREPWRLALAVLEDAFDGAPPLACLPLFEQVAAARVDIVRRQLAVGLNVPRAHGGGRWFDAVGALVLAAPRARYEGELAMRLGGVADPDARRPYGFALDAQPTLATVDLRPAVRALVADVLDGTPAPVVAGRFHATMVAAGAAMVAHAASAAGALPVVLTGGCFQNPLLAAGLVDALGARHRVCLHGDVPPNDGGVALGQAVIAAARLRAGPDRG